MIMPYHFLLPFDQAAATECAVTENAATEAAATEDAVTDTEWAEQPLAAERPPPVPLAGLVLYYPVLDVLDHGGSAPGAATSGYFRFPISVPVLGVEAGSPSVRWFFSRFLCGVDAQDVGSAATTQTLL